MTDGLPKPFSKAPRLTVYKRELYDCAECINLCLLLRDRFPQLEATLETVVREILDSWVKPDGSFRSRRLHLGWDNVPMHRWGQSQMFRALAFYFRESLSRQKTEDGGPKAELTEQRTEERSRGAEDRGLMTEVANRNGQMSEKISSFKNCAFTSSRSSCNKRFFRFPKLFSRKGAML